mmetsp:Transcript_36475/g.79742  ORF Transcript_36475/g.79742 Transcript_36475/m.79742 type:complete len:481 (-) Transcript_36475:46-1488(-)
MRNAPAALLICTDNVHPSIAGTKLTGRVYLDVPPSSSGRSSGINANQLCLSFHGEEVSTIASYVARADTTFREESKCNIISLTVPILDVTDGRLLQDEEDGGQYEMPFEVDLPSWLPSTMICHGQEGSSCGIRYYLEAFSLRDGRQKLACPLVKKEVLILGRSKGDGSGGGGVRRRPLSTPSSSSQVSRATATATDKKVASSEEYKLFSMFCYPRGRVRVESELSASTARLGDTLTLALDVANESECDVDEIEIKLKECVQWRVGIKSSMPRGEKVNRTVSESVISHRQLMKGRRRRQSARSGQVSPASAFGEDWPGDNPTNVKEEGLTRRHHIKINVAIPYDARCTYESGTLLSTDHVLVVTLKLNGCSFLTSQPELHIPLKLLAPSEHQDLMSQMNRRRPRMVRRTVKGHDVCEKVVGENVLFDKLFLDRTYGDRQGDVEKWGHFQDDEWVPTYVGDPVRLDLPSRAKVGGEEEMSLF